MSSANVNWAQESTGLFDVHRFKQRTRRQREAAWQEFRTHGVGGSDMGTILGLNTYRTPCDLWLEKTGRTQHEDISDRWAVVKGNALEVELRRRFRGLHPEYKVIDGTDMSLVSKAHPCMHASLDGFIYDKDRDSWGVLEIKTANANRGRLDWHDKEGNLKAPDYYMAQVTHYLAVTGFTWGVFYADIGENEPVELRFERDEQDVWAVIRAAEKFWGFVTRNEMPALTGADVDRIQAESPYPEGFDSTDDSEFELLSALYESYAESEAEIRKAKSNVADRLKAMVGKDREGLVSPCFQVGYRTVHFKAQEARPAKPAYDQRRFYVKQLSKEER